MSGMSRKKNFILLRQSVGNQKTTLPHLSQQIDVLAGELLIGDDHTTDHTTYLLSNLNPENPIELQCEADNVKLLTEDEFKLLLPIAACSERLKVFKNWLEEGKTLKIGDTVTLYLLKHEVNGKLRFKGCTEDQPGILFGVELNSPLGHSDISNSNRYFNTEHPNTAIIVPLNKIRKYNLPLQIGDRVVWIRDEGPEKATVRWIGNLDNNPDITVGVEFDNPCGTGTGLYNKERLFKTQPGHASLLPMYGLLKESVFLGNNETAETPIPEDPANDYETLDMQGRLSANLPHNQYEDIQNQVKPERKEKSISTYAKHGRTLQQQSSSSYSDMNIPTATVTPFSDRKEIDQTLEIGSMVEIPYKNQLMYGVIRWIGDDEKLGKIVGLEMDEEAAHCSNGYFQNIKRFNCPPRKGFFIGLHKCKRDRRFDEREKIRESMRFGDQLTPDIKAIVAPPYKFDTDQICGKNKGIQGHHNSCYLDVMLFSVFYFTTVLDSIFYRKKTAQDIEEYDMVKQVLAEGIVYPLRQFHYVRADKVMKLRSLLDKVGNMPGMMDEEKDPEELLNCLFGHVMKADPLLQLSSLQQTYSYQLFIERDENLELPTIQQLFEMSFLESNIKLSKVPSCLILQMPRFGKDYKMYKKIVPSLQLDVTNVLEKGPRECVICGKLATKECKECYKVHGEDLYTIAFCDTCDELNHKQKRREHKRTKLKEHKYFCEHTHNQQTIIPREKMELFAVICIETSHYVSFVKNNNEGKEPKWVFYDSMADRQGCNEGYNIPEVRYCPNLQKWITESQLDTVDPDQPELQRRLFSDSYMCLYQNSHVMMFQ